LLTILFSGLWVQLTSWAIVSLQSFNLPDPVVFGLLSWIAISGCFWIPGIMYEVARAKGWWTQWEIDPKARPPLELREQALHAALLSELMRPIPLCVVGMYLNITMKDDDVPSPFTWLWQLCFMEFIAETWFYWFHRALHTKTFYRFHKQHHGFTAPIGISAQYVHLIEGILTGATPTILPIVVLTFLTGEALSFSLILFFFAFRSWWGVDSHCGYEVPWSFGSWIMNDNSHHYWHHKRNTGNYGSCFIPWDLAMGTDKEWRAARKGRLWSF